MNNNKIVDNLNFIKIYFWVFILENSKRPELSRKEIKILKYRLKTCLSARTGSRKPKKGVQNTLEHESSITTQEYHSALLECQIVPLRAKAQFSSNADKAHPFRLFRRKTRPNSHYTRGCLFFMHSSIYK